MRAPGTPQPPDHYATLGIPTTATPRQITHAYRALVRVLHPDTATDTATATGDTRDRFTAVTTAYAVLHDAARRAAYDQTRTAQTRPDAGSDHETATRARTTIPAAPPADAILLGPSARYGTSQPLLRAGPTHVSPLPRDP